ncbi:MAG TPA: hypothetical protein VGP57_21535 [Actinoplanes sp.]|nr:hypothetical protein [Actinoplanes sp.]
MSMITTSDEDALRCTDLLAAPNGRQPAMRDSGAPETPPLLQGRAAPRRIGETR